MVLNVETDTKVHKPSANFPERASPRNSYLYQSNPSCDHGHNKTKLLIMAHTRSQTLKVRVDSYCGGELAVEALNNVFNGLIRVVVKKLSSSDIVRIQEELGDNSGMNNRKRSRVFELREGIIWASDHDLEM